MKTITARINLKATHEGGKKAAVGQGGDYSCPVFFPDIPDLASHGYDCRLLLGRDRRSIQPGDTAEGILLAFLSPHEVLPHINVGTRFVLWESGPIGEGVVTKMPE